MSPLIPSPEQLRILDLGPTSIRVRAGAGTGKTTTVAMVIANLIENHDAQPEQIVGITFTNKAAAELADRIQTTLGGELDPGRQVEIHTYHGFARQVLSEFGAIAGVDNRSKVITPTFARQLMRETFLHRSYDHLDMTQSRTLDRISRLGDRLGDHLMTPQGLIAAHAPHDDVGEARIEMAEVLARYAEDKRRLRVVDYTDLISLSTEVVRTHPELAAVIRERYRAVVLDEYQDTNPAQRVLLSTIFGDGFPVVAVGDEDQTIYEWRGASAQNFELFPTHFPTREGKPAAQLGLTLNRRSDQGILDIANDVRKRANDGADRLQATPEHAGSGEVMTMWATDSLTEADWIARTFEELNHDGVMWSDMAVLFRKNRDFAAVVDSLGRHDIPLEVANIGGLFSVPEVANLRAWLTVLEHPEDSSALIEILFGSRFRLGMADLAPLTRWVAAHDPNPDAEDPTPVSLIEAVENAADVPGLRPQARQALIHFHDLYRDALTESQGVTLVETCRTILDRTRAWQDVEALPPNPRLTARLNLYRLLDLAEDWSPLSGRPSVSAFLDYLKTMEEEPAEELDSARLSGEDAVTLVTVHRAKGLEWDTVALPAVTHGNFPSSSQQYPDPVRFAEHLPVDLRIDSVLDDLPQDEEDRKQYLRERHMRQEWRVAYVAVTRAKHRLLVSGANWYGLPEPTKRAKKPSELFELVEGSPNSLSAGHSAPSDRPEILRLAERAESPDPLFEDGWASALRTAIDDPDSIRAMAEKRGVLDEYENMVDVTKRRLFALAEPQEPVKPANADTVSVTGLVTYAQCPKRYYWNSVDPLPRRPSKAATRGTEVHRRIELHQRGQVPFEEMEAELYDVVDDDRGSGPGAYEAYLASRFADQEALLIETPFSVKLDSGYRVRGRIDAVYADDSSWEVVDFKSGRKSADPSRVVQLEAYAVAVCEVEFGFPRPSELRVTFAYLGGGLEEDSYEVTSQWMSDARKKLEDLTGQIADGRYIEQPGDWCRSCDFLQFCEPGQEHLAE